MPRLGIELSWPRNCKWVVKTTFNFQCYINLSQYWRNLAASMLRIVTIILKCFVKETWHRMQYKLCSLLHAVIFVNILFESFAFANLCPLMSMSILTFWSKWTFPPNVLLVLSCEGIFSNYNHSLFFIWSIFKLCIP